MAATLSEIYDGLPTFKLLSAMFGSKNQLVADRADENAAHPIQGKPSPRGALTGYFSTDVHRITVVPTTLAPGPYHSPRFGDKFKRVDTDPGNVGGYHALVVDLGEGTFQVAVKFVTTDWPILEVKTEPRPGRIIIGRMDSPCIGEDDINALTKTGYTIRGGRILIHGEPSLPKEFRKECRKNAFNIEPTCLGDGYYPISVERDAGGFVSRVTIELV
ncbi:hypothetical protein DFJ74DRAFT_703968 [Hyaloraphidium curvatum]|nr:hypothetical protein DFJ74DRAFT_703968 [Hyaloraphidium curvatum]